MRPVVCILGIGKLSEELRRQLKGMELPADYVFLDAIQDGQVNIPRHIEAFDVFLSSGFIGQKLLGLVDKPVVMIKPSIHDTLMAYSRAVKEHPKTVVITYDTDYSELKNIRNILKFEIAQENYHTLEDRNALLQKYRDLDYRCVVGSGEVCRIAEEYGMKSFFVYPAETLRTYLTLAADMAVSLHRETNKNSQLSSVINFSRQGIVLTDHEGQIFLCNDTFASFFETQAADLLNSSIVTLLGGELGGILELRETEQDQLIKIRGNSYILDAIPIRHKDRLENLVFFLDDVRNIQKSERHIRKNLIARGFVARHSFDSYRSESSTFQDTLETARRYARSDECIVIMGETGTGKEVLAQSIHNYSKRAEHAFVAVNCSAISSTLLESELFGYEEGAFTGARRGGKEGLFEMAHRGTIFLDEIGEIDLAMQTKLLRVVQEKEVMRVGGGKIIPFDARIIVATNQNLLELVRQKKFREDLYYRLNVLELNLPPLCERQEDIFPLFSLFAKEFLPSSASRLTACSPALPELLCSYRWPGNIRELENFVKMLAVITQGVTSPFALFELVAANIKKKMQAENGSAPLHGSVDEVSPPTNELDRIYAALEQSNGKYKAAAELLGISYVTLWRKLKKGRQAKL